MQLRSTRILRGHSKVKNKETKWKKYMYFIDRTPKKNVAGARYTKFVMVKCYERTKHMNRTRFERMTFWYFHVWNQTRYRCANSPLFVM